ncbi:MAG: hypothetical protein AABN34_02020 [Acidobacteriota bacterium]
MADDLIADETLLQEALTYKAEFLAGMFGVAAHAASASGTSAVRARRTFSNVPLTSNIVGVGYGAKLTGGMSVQGEIAVRVYVRSKLPLRALSGADLVRSDINGKPTDVIAVGDVVARARPTSCGVSIGHTAIGAGTLGCVVKCENNPDNIYILSNNHVLANTNDARTGDPILEPGGIDGGDPQNPIANLADFEPLVDGANLMDAAIARVINAADVTPEILDIGYSQQPLMLASLYQSVRKRGRTTLHTVGVVMDLSFDGRVNYGLQSFYFEDQLGIVGVPGPFSAGGDSGSLIVDAVTRRPVALLFADAIGITFANPISAIIDRFGIEIVTNEG